MAAPSLLLVGTFSILALLVSAAFPLGVAWAERRLGASRQSAGRAGSIAALAVMTWMAVTFAAADTGLLAFGRLPPPLGILFLLIVAGAVALAASRVGERLALGLPLAALVGMQGFRFPLELIMHRAATEGVMPHQMSYSGLNFDIVTGITALLVAGFLATGRMPLWGVRTWNWLGSLLLANVLIIAWLSAPTPMRVFTNEPANVWVTTAPFVWLPSICVFAALLGHLLIFRRLRAETRDPAAGSRTRRGVPLANSESRGSESTTRARNHAVRVRYDPLRSRTRGERTTASSTAP